MKAEWRSSNYDNQTIRSTGLFVPIEVDTLRGVRELVDACQGVDKMQLCRALQCAEEGQHFKEYCLAKDFDAEKFQLKDAELGAAKAGKTIWRWLWTSKRVPRPSGGLEFGSESEPEPELKCEAYKVTWADSTQDVRLCKGPCKRENASMCKLLVEDRVSESGEVALCPAHALAYEQQRRSQGCKVQGCNCYGVKELQGVRLCQVHADCRQQGHARRPGKETAVAYEGDDSEEPELPTLEVGAASRTRTPSRARNRFD